MSFLQFIWTLFYEPLVCAQICSVSVSPEEYMKIGLFWETNSGRILLCAFVWFDRRYTFASVYCIWPSFSPFFRESGFCSLTMASLPFVTASWCALSQQRAACSLTMASLPLCHSLVLCGSWLFFSTSGSLSGIGFVSCSEHSSCRDTTDCGLNGS